MDFHSLQLITIEFKLHKLLFIKQHECSIQIWIERHYLFAEGAKENPQQQFQVHSILTASNKKYSESLEFKTKLPQSVLPTVRCLFLGHNKVVAILGFF